MAHMRVMGWTVITDFKEEERDQEHPFLHHSCFSSQNPRHGDGDHATWFRFETMRNEEAALFP
jgi:hypothetical protein